TGNGAMTFTYTTAGVRDTAVKIVKADGTFGSTNKADTSTDWPIADAYATYGGAADLWDETWTAANINDADFGVMLQAEVPSTFTGSVDHMRITVYYTPPTDVNWIAGADYSATGIFKISNSSTLGTTDRLTISGSGNVGIGTAAPSSLFSVLGNVSSSTTNAVATITNNSATDSANTIGLRINLGTATTTTNSRYATFYANVTSGDTGGSREGSIQSTNGGVAYNTGAGDFAERFYVPEPTEPGDIIGIVNGTNAKATANTQLLGVISDTAGFVGNNKEDIDPATNPIVGLLGQVKTKVSTEQGPIAVGDPITSSSTPGVGMKATTAGQVVGIALEQYDGTQQDNKILVFVSPHWLGNDLSVQDQNGQLVNLDPEILRTALGGLGLAIDEEGTLTVTNVKAQNLTVGSEAKPSGITIYDRNTGAPYCVGIENGEWTRVPGLCISETQISAPADSSTSSTSDTTTDTSIPSDITTTTDASALPVDTITTTDTTTPTDTTTTTTPTEPAPEPVAEPVQEPAPVTEPAPEPPPADQPPPPSE
ncbi:MAG: hypothetical protein Q7J73_06140, partial [Dehalococcoidales bacterium]|nr:hypothetical protein [Dehalococcoidales bacterium]